MIIKLPKRMKLDEYEMIQASICGVMRAIRVITENRNETHGSARETMWQRHIEGAFAECCIAKLLNYFWAGVGEIFGPDVAHEQVRMTPRSDGRLIVHESDPDNERFWLVTGMDGNYVIQGWIHGHEAKQKKYWSDPSGKGRPAFFVPQHALYGDFDTDMLVLPAGLEPATTR